MMQDSLLELKKLLGTIKLHNTCFSVLPTVLKSSTVNDKDFITNSWTNERIFNYRSNIISLYGCFEQFIESSIKEYFNELLKICHSFTELDESIRREYIDRWKTLHGRLHFNKFQTITPTFMVKSLYNSLVKDKNEIIAECFLQNGGNYRIEEIRKSFSTLGLTNLNETLRNYEPLVSYYSQNGFDNYSKIDEIVDRRNEIAHGANADDLLSESIVLDYVDYVEMYAESLTSYLNDQLLEHKWKIANPYRIIKPINFYTRNSVVEFYEKDIILREKMDMLVKKPKDYFPRYVSEKLPPFRAKKAQASLSAIKNYNELYGDGDWMFSFQTNYKMTTKFRIALYLS